MYRESLGKSSLDIDSSLDLENLSEDELPLTGDEAANEADEFDPSRTERSEKFIRTAQLLVTGTQERDTELKYLLDSLRQVTGGKRKWGTTEKSEDTERLNGLRNCLSLTRQGKKLILDQSTSAEKFRDSIRLHATGYLAPLINNLVVDWPSTNLDQDITLVDLPGVGVMRDVHADVTRRWIREKAHAIVLVVDHRGMTESLAEALRRSEFSNSLLYSADDPDEDPIVIIAVTRIDDVASEQFRQDKSKRKYEHFETAAELGKGRLRDELRKRLQDIWLSNEEITEVRKQVVDNLLQTLQVHPVSAPEYARIIANEPDDRPFLEDESATGVPSLIESLTTLARNQMRRLNTG